MLPCLVLLGAPATHAQSATETKDKDAERFRAALALIDSSDDTKEIVRGMDVLRSGFPASRPFLVHAAEKGSPKLKCFAVQALGDSGEAKKDLEVVAKRLTDPKATVRLAAVMALRRLGKDGYPALSEYLPGEVEPNNRKMAVKSIQQWDLREAIPLLVKLLQTEKEKTVRNFLVTALESLSRKKLGDDPVAWQAYAGEQALQDQAKSLITTKTSQKDKDEEKP